MCSTQAIINRQKRFGQKPTSVPQVCSKVAPPSSGNIPLEKFVECHPTGASGDVDTSRDRDIEAMTRDLKQLFCSAKENGCIPNSASFSHKNTAMAKLTTLLRGIVGRSDASESKAKLIVQRHLALRRSDHGHRHHHGCGNGHVNSSIHHQDLHSSTTSSSKLSPTKKVAPSPRRRGASLTTPLRISTTPSSPASLQPKYSLFSGHRSKRSRRSTVPTRVESTSWISRYDEVAELAFRI